MRSMKRPRKPVRRYRSLLFPGIALAALFAFWAAFVPSEKGETKAFEKDGLRLEITGVHHEGGFVGRFDPEGKAFVPIDTYHVYPGSKLTVLEAPLKEDGTPRWEFRAGENGMPDRQSLGLTEGMEPIVLSEKGSYHYQICDLEREATALYFVVREEDEDYWK